jgi:hypothetical protein
MKTIFLLAIALGCGFAQQPRPQQPQQSPVPLVATPLPEQDIALTIHVSSEMATAIENDRRRYFKAQVDDATGATTYVPVLPTLADQILARLAEGYLKQVIAKYPSAALKAMQEAVTTARKAADDAAAKAVQVTKKP